MGKLQIASIVEAQIVIQGQLLNPRTNFCVGQQVCGNGKPCKIVGNVGCISGRNPRKASAFVAENLPLFAKIFCGIVPLLGT